MNEKISKSENQTIVEKLSRWLDYHSAFHYLYTAICREHSLYRSQLALMEELGEETINNQVPTEHYKNIEWIDSTVKPRFYW
ncbi:hypothetical protein QP519_11105 [Weeksella virosa]|uniref:hypothetical protein n=1 Tax=Weeksella virosa TaxID=1014 RepID=UPI002554311E|nr:hypothetical protein [Weeksella virosa]MDK7376079.1 hypothetical protein [Weeksella virosa]